MAFWIFGKRTKIHSRISANSVVLRDGVATIDVRGQTCPGYLLAINKAVDGLPSGTRVRLLISYPPCGDDVAAWAVARSVEYLGISQTDGLWVIDIRK